MSTTPTSGVPSQTRINPSYTNMRVGVFGMSKKPAHVQPVGGSIESTEFDTQAEKAAAQEILRHYSETHNLSEIARRSGWSASHIRKVFHQYFEPAQLTSLADIPDELLDEMQIPETLPESSREAFILGYFRGSQQ